MTSAWRHVLEDADGAERLALLPTEIRAAFVDLFEQVCDLAQAAYGSPHGQQSTDPKVQASSTQPGGKVVADQSLVDYLEGWRDKRTGRRHEARLLRRIRGLEREVYAELNPDPRKNARFPETGYSRLGQHKR